MTNCLLVPLYFVVLLYMCILFSFSIKKSEGLLILIGQSIVSADEKMLSILAGNALVNLMSNETKLQINKCID